MDKTAAAATAPVGAPPSSSSAVTTLGTTVSDIVEVTVHPLVLLSAADHYHRVARNTQRRVVGVLLGSVHRGKVDACNSFAVPFEEDRKNPAVFYLDHNFLENMLSMFRKISIKERVVGFYSTGPQIRPNDLRIHALLKRFVQLTPTTPPPVFVIIDVRPDRHSQPTTAYRVVEDNPTDDNTAQMRQTFAHVPSHIRAAESEEVGVEHLLRDINDPTISTVASLIRSKLSGLDTLVEKLEEMKDYLSKVADGTYPKVNQEIVNNSQTILNLLPNLNVEELVKAMLIKTNDLHMVIYLSALIRSVMALHDLVNNKIKYLDEDGEDNSKINPSSSDDGEEKKDEKGDITGEKKEEEGKETKK